MVEERDRIPEGPMELAGKDEGSRKEVKYSHKIGREILVEAEVPV